MRSLRILHIVHSLEIGGLERVVVDLAASFQARGHRTAICCLADGGPLAETAEKSGVIVCALKRRPGIDWRTVRKVPGLIRAGGYDVVHTHNAAGFLYGAVGAKLAGVRNIVHTEHGKEPDYQSRRALKLLERMVMPRVVDHLVSVSPALCNEIAASTGLRRESIHVIFNGIDYRLYRKPFCRRDVLAGLGLTPECFVIGNIARLVPLKNHLFLIRVAAELIKRGKRLKVVIVGDGPLGEQLRKAAAESGIGEHVLFTGARTDIPELLSAFDLFALPSLTEGISITLLEAMAAAVPCAASDVGGNSEIIRDRSMGRLLPLNDLSAWVEELDRLIEDGSERKRIGASGSDFIESNFGLDAMAGKYGRLYAATRGDSCQN